MFYNIKLYNTTHKRVGVLLNSETQQSNNRQIFFSDSQVTFSLDLFTEKLVTTAKNLKNAVVVTFIVVTNR